MEFTAERRDKLDAVRKATKEYKEALEKGYPNELRDIAEYTRLVEQLDQFLKWGFWSIHLEMP